MQLSRRQFIKFGAAATGVGVVGGVTGLASGLTPNQIHPPRTDGETVVPTICELCFWKCGVMAHVRGGRVTKIVGNPRHPLSRGRLCPRGTGGAGLLYDPDRLKTPLIRRDERGRQVFAPISWDDAFAEIASKMLQIKERHGPEAMALFSHGFGGSWFKRLMRAWGSPNVAAPSYAQCRGPRDAGYDLTFGRGVGSPEIVDMRNARVITLIGTHLGENMHNTQVQELAAALRHGAELVVVDPRFSVVAGKAKHWLPIKAGTDIALLLAWMHVIIAEKLYDPEFVRAHTVGFDRLAAHVAEKTPQWAFVHTGIEPEDIARSARLIAGARPASFIHPGRRATWYGDDTQRARAGAILNALLGNWGRRGGFYLPSKMDIPVYPEPRPAASGPDSSTSDSSTSDSSNPGSSNPGSSTSGSSTSDSVGGPRAPADMPKGVVYPFAGAVLAQGLRDASIPGTAPYDIKGWLVYGTNLMSTLPEPEKTQKALQHLDLMVAIDVLPAEIVGWADIVLPEATYLERWDDLDVRAYREPFVALRQPVVPPMFDSRPGHWIAKRLAEELGHADSFAFETPEQMISARLSGIGISLDELKKTGVVVGKAEPATQEEGLLLSFATPSGKVELFSQQLADAGLDPMPHFNAPEPAPAGHYRLLSGRLPVHTFGRTANNRFLGEIASENEVWINRQQAAELGVRAGERVVLINQDGVRSEPIAARVTERIRPDCVYMAHGFGHRAEGLKFAAGRGASHARLVSRQRTDPAMGGTGINVNFVRIERAQA